MKTQYELVYRSEGRIWNVTRERVAYLLRAARSRPMGRANVSRLIDGTYLVHDARASISPIAAA